MRIGLSTALITALGCTPVFGAPPATVARAASPSWEGFYVGGDIGYGIGISKLTQPFEGDIFASHGFIGGLLAGYNYMPAQQWLIGIETDANWSNIEHTETFNDGFGDFVNIKLTEKQAYSVRGRFGYLLEPNTLLYITSGWSWAQFSYSLTSNAGLTAGANPWLGGPVVGFGVETKLGAGWSARLEYLETFYGVGNLGNFNVSSSVNANFDLTPTPLELRPAVGVGRLALVYRFGDGRDGNATISMSPSPTPSWNGPTIAATVAAVSGTAKVDSSEAPGNSINGFGASAILPTALLGYNWRIAPRWVFGVDGGAAPGVSTTDVHVGWTEAAHARLGYLLTPATMLYGSVGWFGTGFHTTELIQNKVSVPQQRTNALEVGAGIETALDSHWAVRFEYQYGFIQAIHDVTVNVTGTVSPPSAQVPVALHPEVQSVQAGIVYNFGL
jgi:outer membrane immunogenic protein